jgi:hypothetical protein
MYYQESDILLQNNPEYGNYIVKLDKLLGTMGPNEGKQLKVEIISDITQIRPEIIDFIFDCYYKAGILTRVKYIFCPIGGDLLGEIEDDHIRKFPTREFCDICGTEHLINENNISIFYKLIKYKSLNDEDMAPLPIKMQLSNVSFKENLVRDADSDIIKQINIHERAKEIAKIASVQLKFELSETFPPETINKSLIQKKIYNALKNAEELGVDIICFPELCICEEWLDDIKLKHPNIIIIPGTYYDKYNHNTCRLLIDSDHAIPEQIKIKPSEFENKIVTGEGMEPGNKIYLYQTKIGRIAILICRDFGNYIKILSNKADVIFVPSYNEAPDRFCEIAHTHVSNHPSYIIISNSSLFGGTSIYGQIDKVYFKRLEQAGCKEKDSEFFKLCEIEKGKEGIVLADFNIIYKAVQKPTPIDPSETKISVTNIKKIPLDIDEMNT